MRYPPVLLVLPVLASATLAPEARAQRTSETRNDRAAVKPIDALTIDDVMLVARETREAFRGIDFVFELRQKVVSGGPPPPNLVDYNRERTVVDLHSGSYHWYKESEEPDTSGKLYNQTIESAFHKGVTTLYLSNNNSGTVEELPKGIIPIKKRSPIVTAAMMYPPETDGHGIDDMSLISLLRHGTLRPGRDAVEGRPCVVVDGMFQRPGEDSPKPYATAWIDVERGALPLRLVAYNKAGGVDSDRRLMDVRPFTDRATKKTFWLPTKTFTTMVLQGLTYEIVYTADPDKLVVNPPFDEKSFVIDFPPGTTVIDKSQNVTFTVPGVPPPPTSLGYARPVKPVERASWYRTAGPMLGMTALAAGVILALILYPRARPGAAGGATAPEDTGA